MSMILTLYKVSASDWKRLGAMGSEDLSAILAKMVWDQREGDPSWAWTKEETWTSLDKRWGVVHAVLNGDIDGGSLPRGFLLNGGEEGPDATYGPYRYLNPSQVKQIAASLADMSPEIFRRELRRSSVVKDAYSYRNGDEEEDVGAYADLRDWVADAAEMNVGLVIEMS